MLYKQIISYECNYIISYMITIGSAKGNWTEYRISVEYSVTTTEKALIKKVQVLNDLDWRIRITTWAYERSIQESDKSREETVLYLVVGIFKLWYLSNGREEKREWPFASDPW